MPTLIIQPSTKDNLVEEPYPNNNYGTFVGVWAWDLVDYLQRSILSFDISGIPGGAVLAEARLFLYCWRITGAAGTALSVYKMTRPTWVEAEATWNIYSAGNNWTTPGGDYVTNNPSGGSAIPVVDAWMEVDIKDIIQDAYNSSIDAHLLVKFATEDVSFAVDSHPMFHSRDYTTDVALRPMLIVTYNIIGRSQAHIIS